MSREGAVATDIQPTANEPAWQPYRLSVSQFLAMIDAGIFPHDAHVELLGGVLVQMMTKGDPHDSTLDSIAEELRRLTPAGWILREDKSLQLGPRSRPEPDVAIVRGPRKQYGRRTPHARETALVIEVAESSYAYDRGEKWRAYAAARIPIYWIVNLEKEQIEVFTNPMGRGKSASYRELTLFGVDDEVPLFIEGHEVGRISVKDILP
jgi:Uma2 family endonuclease